jgi:hypothetical protein
VTALKPSAISFDTLAMAAASGSVCARIPSVSRASIVLRLPTIVSAIQFLSSSVSSIASFHLFFAFFPAFLAAFFPAFFALAQRVCAAFLAFSARCSGVAAANPFATPEPVRPSSQYRPDIHLPYRFSLQIDLELGVTVRLRVVVNSSKLACSLRCARPMDTTIWAPSCKIADGLDLLIVLLVSPLQLIHWLTQGSCHFCLPSLL